MLSSYDSRFIFIYPSLFFSYSSRLFPSNENRRYRPRSCSRPYAIDFPSLSLSLAFVCLSFVFRSILLFFSAREMQEMETRRWKITITDATATASDYSTTAGGSLPHARTHTRTHARIAPTRFKYERRRCTRVVVATCVTVTLIARRILNRVTLSCIMHTRYYRDPYERAARGGGHVCVCTAVHSQQPDSISTRCVVHIDCA